MTLQIFTVLMVSLVMLLKTMCSKHRRLWTLLQLQNCVVLLDWLTWRDRVEEQSYRQHQFPFFLELVPEVRELINDFYSSRYALCLEYLENLKANMLLDIHFAFKTNVAGQEKELEALITDNQIRAQIDSHNKILYARHADQRNATFQRVLQTGSEFDRDVRAMLLRANLLKHECNARAARKCL
ncbi:hypothetical protein NE237_011182 [Protea cynaroides]|uniref:COP9 signalosome complex subunit 1 C-terminal helix domain-containing protein n=1 Tax=Protea cynaroides TaxID=273540 RepID=A0A9Q0GZE4_9MAGN|nr:hypothetical protein NE237_011182 [Protea cynaroides]